MEYGTVDNSLQTADVNAVEVALGTIHILRKHYYSTKLNLTPKIFMKQFFVKTEEFLFHHYILTKFYAVV